MKNAALYSIQKLEKLANDDFPWNIIQFVPILCICWKNRLHICQGDTEFSIECTNYRMEIGRHRIVRGRYKTELRDIVRPLIHRIDFSNINGAHLFGSLCLYQMMITARSN